MRQNYPPFLIRDIESPLKIWTNKKKTHQKILIFDKVMACHRSPFFGALRNYLKFSHGIWRHWRMEVENEWSFSLKHHLNNVLQFSSESMSVRYIIAFLCKKRPLSPKKWISLSETQPFFRYDVINSEFGQIWVNPLIAVMRPLHT